MDAYLDIETSFRKEITIFGLYREDTGVHQLIGKENSAQRINDLLSGVRTIYSFNGNRFDLPVIARCTGARLKERYVSHDLMYDCWKKNLYGGLKRVEQVLRIKRQSIGIDGYQAMELWERYFWYKDQQALDLLLEYNREDVVNLVALRERLAEYS